MQEAEKATWPLISRIEATTKICRAIRLYRHKLKVELKEEHIEQANANMRKVS